MPLPPATLKGCNFIITLESSSSVIDIVESISCQYDVTGISEILVLGIGEKDHTFKASTLSGWNRSTTTGGGNGGN
jgi:hypothetical protein